MSQKPLDDAALQAALDALTVHGTQIAAARALNLPRATYTNRLKEAERRGIRADPSLAPIIQEASGSSETELLRNRVRTLETLLRQKHEDDLNAERVRSSILKLTDVTANPPNWLVSKKPSKSSPGTPTLFLSDLHWGEVVDPSQIGFVNEYNIEIAQRRIRTVVDHTVDLLKNHLVYTSYPGMVLALGGDMVTGDIHEELSATNEMEIMPTFVDLFDCLVWVIETLANEFGALFAPCVGGNHGRSTHKIRAKGRNFTSYDWLLYTMLERHFKADKRVKFYIPNGPDALYKVHNHRYLLTHGDQFRGGDSMIGPLGPITRGDHKKRSRNSQINQEYDTIVMGHWHQDIRLRKLIVNGSLKGYDEYAFANNFPFEPPSQALWITHPRNGITFPLTVFAERSKANAAPEWVSVK